MPGPDARTAERRGGPRPRTHTQGEEALVRARVPAPTTSRPAACLPPRPAPRARARELRADQLLARSGGVAREREGGVDREPANLRVAPRAQPARHTAERRVRAEGGGWSPRGAVTRIAHFHLFEVPLPRRIP